MCCSTQGGGLGPVPGSLPYHRACQPGKQRWTHDIPSKQNLNSSTHTPPCSLLNVFVFFSLSLLYFRSDRFVGQAEVGLRANLEGEKPGGQRRGLPSSYRTRKGAVLETLEKCLPYCSGRQSRLQPLDPPFQSKGFLFFTFGLLFPNAL